MYEDSILVLFHTGDRRLFRFLGRHQNRKRMLDMFRLRLSLPFDNAVAIGGYV